MVIAHHLILNGYGHWLPNDPRGSLSKEIGAGRLYVLGDIHYGRKSPQPSRNELRAFKTAAKPRLKHEVLWFDGERRNIIAESSAALIAHRRWTCFACAIMSNHVHLVIRRHRDRAETMHLELRKASAIQLRGTQGIPTSHPIWSTDPYKDFLFLPADVLRVVKYVEDNPAKAGEPAQSHPFVTPYRGEWSGRARG